MRHRHTRVTAVVTHAVAYRDNDLIVTLVTRERGRLGALARGARKNSKRFGGALEVGSRIDAEVDEGARGALVTLSECELRANPARLRRDLDTLSLALYACDVARQMCREEEPAEQLYHALEAVLEGLSQAGAGAASLATIDLCLLTSQGFGPQTAGCLKCGTGLMAGAFFSVEEGGLVCREHRREGDAMLGVKAVVMLREMAARALGDDEVEAFVEGSLEADEVAALRQIEAALGGFVEHVVGHTIRSRSVLRALQKS